MEIVTGNLTETETFRPEKNQPHTIEIDFMVILYFISGILIFIILFFLGYFVRKTYILVKRDKVIMIKNF